MFGTQVMARKPGYLMRLVHGLEHRKRRATAHIRGQRRRHAGPLGGGKIKQAAAQELIRRGAVRSEEHTSELQSLMRISYAVFCLKKKNTLRQHRHLKHEKLTT